MNELRTYLNKRGITEEQMEEGRRATQTYIEAFNNSTEEERSPDDSVVSISDASFKTS